MNKSNQSTFEFLFETYHAMVMQMCLGYTNNDRDIASDLAQEVFVNILHALDKFEGRSSHKTWIYRITVNTCLHYKRKEKKKSQLPIDDVEHQLTVEHKDQNEENQALYNAINQLAEFDRLIIMMILEELEYPEISEVLGITEATLRVKIHRIRKRLKKIMTNG